MENLDNDLPIQTNELIITNDIKLFLSSAGKWAKFLAIIGFIFSGLITIAAIVVIISNKFVLSFNSLNHLGGMQWSNMYAFFSVFYLVLAAVYYMISLYLFRFGKKIQLAISYNLFDEMYSGFKNLKSYFKSIGILMIAMIVFYLIVIIAMGTFFSMKYL